MHDHILSCTFCKKTEHQVQKLVSGPGVYICDRCTERAHAIVCENAPPSSPVSVWQRATSQLGRLLRNERRKRGLRRASEHAA